jgi:hypothetical protein
MRRTFAVLVLCAGAPAASYGQVYAGAELGYASADFSLGAPYNGVVDDRSMSLGAEVGFSIRERFALELGVTKFGSFDGRATPCAPGMTCTLIVLPTGSNDVTAYNISLIPHIELADVELYAELGYYGMRIDTEIGLPDSDFRERGALLGVGARWYFREPWSLSLEAVRYDDKVYQIALGAGWGLRLGGERPERSERRERDERQPAAPR